jgi:thiol-disulfide isomerase/thioredoxin
MNRFLGIALRAGLLGSLLLGCSKTNKSGFEPAEPPKRFVTMEDQKALMDKLAREGKLGGAGSQSKPKQAIGAAAPETVGRDLDGKEIKLSDLKGKVVVLDFWATWCPPCRAMIPHTNQLFEKMKGKPVVIVSVSADNKQEDLTKFLKTNKMPWTHWFDGPNGSVGQLWGIRAYPTIYVIDHKGVVRHHQEGGSHAMDAVIEKLVKEADENKVALR